MAHAVKQTGLSLTEMGKDHPFVQDIIADLEAKKLTKKEIANKYKVDLGVVVLIGKRFMIKPVDIEQPKEEIITTSEDEEVFKSFHYCGVTFNTTISDTYSMLYDAKNGMSKKQIAKKYKCGQQKAQDICTAKSLIVKAHVQCKDEGVATIMRPKSETINQIIDFMGNQFSLPNGEENDGIRITMHSSGSYTAEWITKAKIIEEVAPQIPTLAPVKSIPDPIKPAPVPEVKSTTTINVNKLTTNQLLGNKPHTKFASKLPDLAVLRIMIDKKINNISQRDIAMKYGIAQSTVSRYVRHFEGKSLEEIARELGCSDLLEKAIKSTKEIKGVVTNKHIEAAKNMEFEQPKNKPTAKKEEPKDNNDIETLPRDYEVEAMEQASTQNSDIQDVRPINAGAIIRCGLIKDRHIMPVSIFVFDMNYFNKKLINDYPKQEEICNKFLDNYVGFDKAGIAKKDVVLYCTGLQCALASFIKVCHDRNVNLILRHHNPSSNTYSFQPIWQGFGSHRNSCPTSMIGSIMNSRYAYTYKYDASELDNESELYIVSRTIYKNTTANYIDHVVVYICKTLEDANELHVRLMPELINGDKKYSIYVDRLTKYQGAWGRGDDKNNRIFKTQNW